MNTSPFFHSERNAVVWLPAPKLAEVGREMESCFWAVLLAVLAFSPLAMATRIRGSWSYRPSGDRLIYLTKFGVQEGHQVYAYGTSVRRTSGGHVGFDETLVLGFVPSSTWERFYRLERRSGHDCQDFMEPPFKGSLAPDERCYQKNYTADLYRMVPCDYQQQCKNQHLTPLVPRSAFTFRITSHSSQYFYLFMVGCNQNANTTLPCVWFPSNDVAIDYDIHIVNQDPQFPTNPFTYEFSYNLIGMMIAYIIFTCVYFAVLIFHLLVHSCICTPHNYKHHRLTHIFTSSLLLEALHVLLVMAHYCVYSKNGVGVAALLYMGQALNFISDWLLILVLILIGKGWQITTATIRWKKTTLVIWITYIFVSAIFFSWILVRITQCVCVVSH